MKLNPLIPTQVQFGKGLSDREIVERLLQSFCDHLTKPVHYIPDIEILPEILEFPRRGIMW